MQYRARPIVALLCAALAAPAAAQDAPTRFAVFGDSPDRAAFFDAQRAARDAAATALAQQRAAEAARAHGGTADTAVRLVPFAHDPYLAQCHEIPAPPGLTWDPGPQNRLHPRAGATPRGTGRLACVTARHRFGYPSHGPFAPYGPRNTVTLRIGPDGTTFTQSLRRPGLALDIRID